MPHIRHVATEGIITAPPIPEARIRALYFRAEQRDDPPSYEAGNPVPCLGEALRLPIYWQGRQLSVTAFGVECRDGRYAIPCDRLREDGWIMHMAEKEWVDLEDFAEALRIARPRERASAPA
jgi:hypothetical protein